MANPVSPLPAGTVALEPSNSFGKSMLLFGLFAPVLCFFGALFLGITVAVVLAVVAVVALLVGSRHALLGRLRWHSPSLQVTSRPYALGSMPIVVYRRKPKRVTDIAKCSVQCLLVCEEEVTYQQGTDTRTDRRRVYEQRCDGTGEGTAEGLVAELALDISAHMGAPSFKLKHNQVEWFVEISVTGPALPRDQHRFTIKVAPVLDPAHRVGLQDS